ncbi:MAG: HD domain-containing protein [Syntrophobacteraceae bacterium]|jgi:predicted hydrolase (HD superfamily)
MEDLGITKEQADELVEKYIKEPMTKLHLLESEAIMRGLAKYLNEDEEKWGIIGLLHDIDWDLTKNNQDLHCIKAQEILRQAGASEFLIENVVSHGYDNEMIPSLRDKKRKTIIQHCLVAAETLTGIIIASALVQPDKKLSSVQLPSLKKKFKSKSFAANCNRDQVGECEKAGISVDTFLEIGLHALQGKGRHR